MSPWESKICIIPIVRSLKKKEDLERKYDKDFSSFQARSFTHLLWIRATDQHSTSKSKLACSTLNQGTNKHLFLHPEPCLSFVLITSHQKFTQSGHHLQCKLTVQKCRKVFILPHLQQCCCSVSQSCPTLRDPHGWQHAWPPCLTPSPKVCPSSCLFHR